MIPNLPQPSSEVVNDQKMLDTIWYLFLSQLITELQNQLSPNGMMIPSQNTATIATLNNAKTLNTMIINSDTQQLLVNITGVYQAVSLVPY
jgi:hypothetical protein